MFRFVGHNESEATLPTIIKDNLKVIIVIQFLVNTYTFPFVVEIILTPILALVLLIDSVARTDERNLIVTKLTTPVIVSLVLMIIIFAIYKAAGDVDNLASTFTLRKLLLAPLLSALLLVPWIYLVRVYLVYEDVFIRLSIWHYKSTVIEMVRKGAIDTAISS